MEESKPPALRPCDGNLKEVRLPQVPIKSCCVPSSPRPAETVPAMALRSSAEVPDASDVVPLPGGTFLMGSEHAEVVAGDGEAPVREVSISPFHVDRFPVTNHRFARFIEQTGYRTEAETFGWSFVFWAHIPKKRFWDVVEDTVAAAPWWCKVPGASWPHPEGPASTLAGRGNHPVVHVTWNDAQAFCAWSGRRLLTEAEWEYAARGGLVQKLYPWGDTLRLNGRHQCNIWQGKFPELDTAEDGYSGTCPVDAFPPNNFGLSSLAGNVWEWCADWWSVDHATEAPLQNPRGPATGVSRVMRGGSFLCHKSYCNRYRVSARTAQTPDSSTSNVGFRCAVDAASLDEVS